MPPEQAIGAVDQITARSDVFGLGAILCVILTGQPPFVSDNPESSRLKAARGKLDEAFARLDSCGAEPDLLALAKRCLAPEPQDRPRNAGEVAEAIAAHRADAEQRARQAEMERARAEVRSAEERKRRRVNALLLTLFTLVAVTGFAAWWIESARAERESERFKRQADQKSRENELLSRQLTTERDVIAALNEAQVLREAGWKQADDTARWALTLAEARSSYKRAESLLTSGEATEELRARVSAAGNDLDRDERDRSLLAKLDKIEEDSDFRFLISATMTDRYADRYSQAFRAYGVELLAMSTSDAVGWLKRHRFRDRLILAIQNWRQVLSGASVAGPNMNFILIESALASAAVAGQAVYQSLWNRPSTRDRLNAILKEVDSPFAREWNNALTRGNAATFKKLFTRSEFHQLSSRELLSLVDASWQSGPFRPNSELLWELLSISYDRFPGEYWVNFRLGYVSTIRLSKESKSEKRLKSIRYLSAAVAARPNSAIPRVALGTTLLEQDKNDPVGVRLLRGAAAVDPTCVWPHVFLADSAKQLENWPEMLAAYREAVRVDPDIGCHMFFILLQFDSRLQAALLRNVAQNDLARFYDELVALHPEHPGGFILRAGFRQNTDDYRLALADYRKALPLMSADHPFLAHATLALKSLEAMARWEAKLSAVLKGELRPANAREMVELAEYCAGFEKKYVLAVRFATEALAAESIKSDLWPFQTDQWSNVSRYAGWAIEAAAGKGVDAAKLSAVEQSELRKKALAWLRQFKSTVGKNELMFGLGSIWLEPRLAAVREPESIAKLPLDERAEWTKFWADFPGSQRQKKLEMAPPPREKKLEIAPPPKVKK